MLVTAFVPSLVAAGLLANQARILAEQADTATQVERQVDSAVTLGATLDTIEGERGLSNGLASLEVLGLTEEEANDLIGYDLRPELVRFRAELDEELQALDQDLLSAELADLLDQLPETRAAIDDGTLGPGGIDAYFRELSHQASDHAELNLLVGTTTLGELDAPELVSSLQTIKTLNDISYGGAQWMAQAYIHNFLPTDASGLALVLQSELLANDIAQLEEMNPHLAAIPEWAAIADGTHQSRYTDHVLDERAASRCRRTRTTSSY